MTASRNTLGNFVAGCALAFSLAGGSALSQEASPSGVRVGVSRELRRAEAALETPISFDYVETSLAEVLDDLQRQIRWPIQVHFDPDEFTPEYLAEMRITATAEDMPCREAAPLLFEDANLILDVRAHGVALVGDYDVQRYRRSYDVREIIRAWAAEQKPLAYFGPRVSGFPDPVRRPGSTTPLGAILLPKRPEDELISFVGTAIAPDSWAPFGGEGALEYEPVEDLLVVYQTYDIHHEVEHLLNLLLAAIRSHDAGASGRQQ